MLGTTMRIELATSEDRDTFIELNRAVQDLHAAAHPEIFKPSSEVVLPSSWFADLVEQNTVWVWLARDEHGRGVGYLYAEHKERPESVFQRAMHVLYIHHIAVRPDARGRGIGTALMQHARVVANKRGIRRIELDVWSFNLHARRLFAALGFHVFNEKLALTW
jgi:ribosomal protein S18 acetylase RimI-like enzyme